MRRVVLLLLVAAALYWAVREHATVTGVIDRITRPLFGSKAAVQESEHNRIVDEAAPAAIDDQDARVGMLKEGLTSAEVRQLVGPPASVDPFVEEGKRRVRWTYPKLRRELVLEDNRVVSVAIQ